jgi:hypothetical protein
MTSLGNVTQESISSLIPLSTFWKNNESFLRQLEKAELPSATRLICQDISNTENAIDRKGNATVNYDLINIYDNRKHFFSIIAELTPDHSSIVREEIVAGTKLSDAKKTTIDGNRITNKAHVEWLKEMSRSEVSHLFRV